MRVRLDPVSHTHLSFCRKVRNENARLFFYSKDITKEDEEKWYSRYSLNENEHMYVIWATTKMGIGMCKVGMIGYSVRKHGSEIVGASLIQSHYKRGIMSMVIPELAKRVPDAKKLFVLVKKDNQYGFVWYLKNGFERYGESDVCWHLKYKEN